MKRILTLVLMGILVTSTGAAEGRAYTRNVAIVVYDNAEPLDWTGPFEVYNDAGNFARVNGEKAFNVYVVSKTTDPVNSQGMTVVPNYSIENAPKPDIVLFPGGPSSVVYDDPVFFAWAEKACREAEIAQSVCTGAFVLGKAGLLDNIEVTTHYGSIDGLQKKYPKAQVRRGRRFVDNGHVVTTAGISAGIDGSLHVVARLLGRRVADDVATYMEYHWSPESSLALGYTYLNPSTDDIGRRAQSGDIQISEKDYAAAAETFRAILKEQPENKDAWLNLAFALQGRKEHAGAAEAFTNAAAGTADHMTAYHYYYAAAQFALADRRDEALDSLRKAFDAGFPNRRAVLNDDDFAGLRGDPRLEELVASK